MNAPPAPRRANAYALLALAALPLAPAGAAAQSSPQIEKVRIGLPPGKSGQEGGLSRNGSWAPVYVRLKGSNEGSPANAYRLAVQTNDIEEVPYRSVRAVPALAAGEEREVIVYVVPGSDTSDFYVRLEGLEEGSSPPRWRKVQELPRLTRNTNQEQAVGPTDVLFLCAGPGLSQLRRTGEELNEEEKPKADGKKGEVFENPNQARRRFAFAETVSTLPDRWFGYEGVDVVVLGTGSKPFVEQLLLDAEAARRGALLEWVRRGGRLVVSVGSNYQAVGKLFEPSKMRLLDCGVGGTAAVKGKALTQLTRQWCQRDDLGPLPLGELAKLVVGPGVSVLLSEGAEGADEKLPVLVQGSYGLGRVVLLAFDVDGPPFTTWAGQRPFWKRLQGELVAALAGQAPPSPAAKDMRMELKAGLETLGDEVPVISFGWVALFVLFYIVLVGPLDYLVLKKLFKRLELTWVTFPATVLVVSVTAYAVAYAMKGDDLRINKVDLIEIDLHHAPPNARRVYGHSWFSLFSPRISSYTVSIEGATPVWGAPPPGPNWPGPVVTMLEGTDRGMRTGTQGLFPRPYEYAEDAAGLRGVPVPVWATRSFTASWTTPINAKAPPIDLREIGEEGEVGALKSRDQDAALTGRITNNLPVELQEATLFYRDRWYKLGTLAAGESRRIDGLFEANVHGERGALGEWFAQATALAPRLALAPSGRPLSADFLARRSAYLVMDQLLFYQASRGHIHWRGGPGPQRLELINSGLRAFDQSWRLRPQPVSSRFRDEAILVARTPMLSDRAEQVTRNGGAPSRLWVGALPGDREERPDVPGFLTQETYVRVYIPVQTK
jgi:hypothetical protein